MPFFPERVTPIFLNMSFGEMWTFQKICSHKKRNILYWAIVWQVMGVSGEVLLWIQLALSFHWQTVSWCVSVQSSSVQSLSCVQVFSTPWIAARQASLSITISRSSLKPMSIESVMPSSHLILCRPLLLLLPIPPSIRVFSNESTLCMRWPKYWSFSFSISPSSEHPGLISFRMD